MVRFDLLLTFLSSSSVVSFIRQTQRRVYFFLQIIMRGILIEIKKKPTKKKQKNPQQNQKQKQIK